ncbi:MAG: 4-hydroxybenzoyl-CoA reductase subunit alpha [Alphaproteobacteria bacterium]|nr:4-hydroxybenzoyl-CoA reductase subunit alpha [Alphaproteobacteria bacterium]
MTGSARDHAIGRRLPLIDGPEKVTGAARYTADIAAPDALVGRILRSPHAHAEIVEVDVAAARALPGVAAVVTGADCDQTYGVLPIAMNEYPLARGRVRYRGEPVAAVAAVDAATAERAIGLIRFTARELPAYFSADAARAPGATPLHAGSPNNIQREVHHEFGDVTAGFAAAKLVREATYRCAEVTHAHIEPHAALARWDGERGQLTLWTVSQVPYYVHLMLARCLGVAESRIRVVKPFVGGGFGARTETLNFELVAALLARAANGAVKVELSREETALTHRGRPETEVRLKLGMAENGRVTAAACEVVQRGGAYAGYGIVTVLYAGALLHAIYDIAAVRYDGYRVYTNTPPCGAMRGHGTVNVRHAFECLMDEMAEALGLDPFAVRRANLLAAPCTTPNGAIVNSCGLAECLDRVERASAWRERRRQPAPGRGLGMACSHYVSGAAKPVHWTGEPHAVVNLKLDFDGSVTLLTGAADIGQGSSTVLAQVAAEVLGIAVERIRVIANDSAVTPKDNGSYSSRVTFMVGNAALDAAQKLRRRLIEAAARLLDADPAIVECGDEVFRVPGGQHEGLAFDAVVRAALGEAGPITTSGSFTVPVAYQGGKQRGGAVGATMGYSYAAQVVEVAVDQETGAIAVERVWVAHDCGRALNPLSVEGQVQGSVWMGMGQALSEETRYEDGLPLAANLLDYRVPTIQESPPIDVQIVESVDPNGPFGAKEAGEGSLAGFMPALANAVADAIGVRFLELPITPDKVLEALAKRRRELRLAAARGAA